MFFDSIRIESGDLKDEFLLSVFTAFPVALMQGKAADRHVLPRLNREIEV